MNTQSSLSSAALICLGLALTGCGSSAPRPVEEMSRARTLIQQAEQAGAQQFAGADLQRARDHLQSAETADKEKDGVTARQRALEASADAEVAAAKTRQGNAEQAVKELADSVSALERESGRTVTEKEDQLRQTPQQPQ